MRRFVSTSPRVRRTAAVTLAGGALFFAAACDFSVTNPGPVKDADLNTPLAMEALVNGMAGNLSLALGNVALSESVIADELTESGNYLDLNNYSHGHIFPDDVNGIYADMQRARWTAESGIDRMKTVLGDSFDSNILAVRAYLYAGFSNRILGENTCSAVIDGGPLESDSVYFERADSEFTQALQLAQAQGIDSLATTALAGRAEVRAALGKWSDAVADAELVPTSFVFWAIFSTNTDRENNDLAYETHSRREVSVFGTQWAEMYGDPRLPWDTVYTSAHKIQTGQDGHTSFFRQQKYTGLDSYIPLAKGTEMLLIRAEAALRDGGKYTTAMGFVNEERAAYGLGPLIAADADEAWTILQRERGAELWLETRRLWDLRRWYAEGRNSFLEGRDKCIPLSTNEQASNQNL
jgi:hypothetical protein